jgi:hypothetical protein
MRAPDAILSATVTLEFGWSNHAVDKICDKGRQSR